MALTPNSTSPSDTAKLSAQDEIAIREIDEAVRKDDTTQFLSRYGLAIGGVLAAVLLGLAGYLFWNSQVEAALEADSEELIRTIDYAQAEDFRSVGERTDPLLDAETPGARTSARLMAASAAIEQGESARAVELYAQIAADADAPPALRDLALLREVATNFDDREPANIIARLEPLVEPGNPFYGSAAELTAIAHLEAGNPQEAGTLFAAIAQNEDLPAALRDRALQMTGQLGIDAVEDVEELLEEQGIAPQGAGAPAAAAR